MAVWLGRRLLGRHLGALFFATLATRINAQLFVLLAREGATMAVSMLLLTALLECASLSNVRHLRSLTGGKSLYLQAWWRNVYNAILLGVPIYVSVCSWPNCFIRRGDGPSGVDWSVGTVDASEVAVVVLLHSLWYYLSHTAFHKVPGLFFVHKFHHRFRGKSVSPSTALAVSPLEFIFAYISAFGPGLVLLKPSRATLQASLVVVMGHNLLMHFPPVEEASRWLPRVLVRTADHLSHHKHPGDKLSGHTLSYDYIGELLQLKRLLPNRFGGPFSCANADCIVSGAGAAGACRQPRRSL